MSHNKRKPFNPFISTEAELGVKKAQSGKIEGSARSKEELARLAFGDLNFMLREELRPVRLQLELLRPELVQQDLGIESTVVMFGSARVSDTEASAQRVKKAEEQLAQDPENVELQLALAKQKSLANSTCYYQEARKLSRIISERYGNDLQYVVVTGGGPGIMEAANRGAHDVQAKSIGLSISLPMEEAPNPYITPELSFHFHYFAIRKMHFLIRAKALVAFPGGFGTLDELFEALTLVQTKKINPIPIILFGKQFWQRVINFDTLVEYAFINPEDIGLFQFVETSEEVVKILDHFYQKDESVFSNESL